MEILRPVVDLSGLQGASRFGWWAGPVLLLAAAAVAFFTKSLALAKMSLGEFCRTYAPLFLVYAVLVALLLLGPKKDRAIYMIVCFHGSAWWVFTTRQLARRDRMVPVRGLAWFRETQAGFQTLHVALVLFFVALAAVWAYGFERSLAHPLGWLVSREAFGYWTLGHVTLSFMPKLK